jgi:uncharacterized membrane protein
MNNEFQKHVKEWQEVRLSKLEKDDMLKQIFERPLPSPYARYLRVFAYVQRPALLALLIGLGVSSSLVYASTRSLPGETLYSLKTAVVEPVVDALTFKPEEKLLREEEKVSTRISEAEALQKQNKLDDKKAEDLKRKIEKSSNGFVKAAEAVAKKSATSTEKQDEKREELKNKFKEKLNQSEQEPEERGGEKIERLKDRAVQVLEGRDNKVPLEKGL